MDAGLLLGFGPFSPCMFEDVSLCMRKVETFLLGQITVWCEAVCQMSTCRHIKSRLQSHHLFGIPSNSSMTWWQVRLNEVIGAICAVLLNLLFQLETSICHERSMCFADLHCA
jgi:hypothetical protein